MSSPIFSMQDNPPPQPWPPTPSPSYPGLGKATGIELAFKDDPIGHALQTLKMRRLDSYKQGIYILPLAKPGLQAKDDAVLPLMETVQGFLAGDGQVMLILGDSGAGKSTFNRHLEHQLWENYRPGGAIPLFINLPALDRPEKLLLVEHLRTLDFSEKQIQELKQHRHFVLICDGYDESQLTCNLHTTNLFNQPGQWSVKLVVTCRTQYLGKDYNDQFVPMAPGQYFRPATDLFQEAVLAPFTRSQIEDYVERYVPLEPRTWVKEDYMDKLIVIPGLLGLVKNPFLLTLCLEALPSVVEGKADLFKLRVTRVQLYDHFVKHWLGVNKRRLLNQKLSVGGQAAYTDLMDDGFEQSAVDFQKDLAAAIFTHQDGRPVVDYTPKNDRNSWKADFFSPEPRTTLLRGVCLLSRMGNQYRFVHRSVLEYFYSCTVCPPPAIDKDSNSQGSPESTSALPSIADHPLSHRSLVAEPSIVQFLAQRAQANPEFKQRLHALLERSKTDDHAYRAAANAITILIRAGVQFNKADLRGVKISGADLSNGQFDSAQFQEANLTGVNFAKSWIRQARFQNARMDGVQFGELPYLVESGDVHACAFSPDGRSLAVGLDSGVINVYETATWTRTCVFRGHQSRITSLAYSPSSHRLLSGSEDKTVRLWNCPTWFCDIILTEHIGKVTAVAFSPSGRQVASLSGDMSVRLWDAETGSLVAVLGGDTKVSGLAYSPDGRTIISGRSDGTIQTFDAQTRTRGLVLNRGRKPADEGVCCVAFSPDGQWILSGTESGALHLCEVNSGTLRLSWKGHDGAVSSVIYSPNGQWIASASQDRTVKLWNAQTGTLVSALTGHKAAVVSISFSGGCAQLASCGSDMTVRLWEVSDVLAGPDYRSSIGSVTSVAYSPDGTHLIYGSIDGCILRYDISNNQSSLAVPPCCYNGGIILYSTDGHRIVTTNNKTIVCIWDTEMGRLSTALPNHMEGKRRVSALAYSPCGRWIAAGSDDGIVMLWDARSVQRSHVFHGHSALVTSVSFPPSGSHIVSGSYDGSVRIWDLENYIPLRILLLPNVSRRIETVAWLPTMPLIALADGRREIQLWTEQTGRIHQHLIHDKGVSAFGVSSCGQWIAAGCANSVWLWHCSPNDESHHWERTAVISNVFEVIKAIVWKPRDHEFVVNCADGSARAWKLQNVSNQMSTELVWSIGSTAFEASGAVITDTVGLSRTNQRLLKQRGAIDESSSSSGLEYQGMPDALAQSNPLDASNLSDMEEWHWEEEDEDDEGQEGEDDGEEEEQEEDDE